MVERWLELTHRDGLVSLQFVHCLGQVGNFCLRRLLRTVPVLLVAFAALSSGRASAEPRSPDSDKAIELGRIAIAYYERGSWEKAYSEFERAEAEAHSPVFGLYMARCKRQQGALLAARALYQRVAAEKLTPDAPPPWSHAVLTAKAERQALSAIIPSICLRVEPGSDIVRASLADRTLYLSQDCQVIELDPGEYSLTLWDAAGRKSARRIRLLEAERTDLPLGRLEPERMPGAPRSPPVPAPTSASYNLRDRSDSPSWHGALGYAALGIGAAGLAVATVAGVIAAVKRGELDCPQDKCSRADAPEARSASRWASVSTVGFIFGGASAAAGGVVLFVIPGDRPSSGALVVSGKF